MIIASNGRIAQGEALPKINSLATEPFSSWHTGKEHPCVHGQRHQPNNVVQVNEGESSWL